MKYKILAMDIDDTLVSDAVTISKENIEAIKRAQAAGVFVTIATGRGYFGSSPIWKQLGIEGYVINYGGAIVMDTRTNQPAFATEVKNDLLQEALDYAHVRGVHAQIYQGDTIIMEKENDFAKWYVSRLQLPFEIDPDIRKKNWKNVPKVLYLASPEDAERLIPEVQAHFGERLKVSGSKPGYVEINAPEANKGTGLAAVAKMMGIAQEETVAVGDNTLDEEMIIWAGLGAAVGDAQERIKSLADVIVPNCDDHGVAWLIDHYILN